MFIDKLVFDSLNSGGGEVLGNRLFMKYCLIFFLWVDLRNFIKINQYIFNYEEICHGCVSNVVLSADCCSRKCRK